MRLGCSLAALVTLSVPALSQEPCVGPAQVLSPVVGGGVSFGWEVDVSGDVLAVADFSEEAVTVFRRTGMGWSFEQVLTPPNPVFNFASSVAVDGSTVAVGALAVSDGRVVVFERVAGSWVATQMLEPATSGQESYGMAVALDGDRLAVAAPNVGGVYVYLRTAGTWALEDFAVAHTPSGSAGDVALDGDVLVVGNERHFFAVGEVEVLRRSGSRWLHEASLTSGSGMFDKFGANLALDGDTLLAGAYDGVHVFERTGTSWPETALITVPPGVDFIGGSVALAGDVALVGNLYEEVAGIDVGSVRPFERTAQGWVPRGAWYGDPTGGAVGWSVASEGGAYASGSPSVAGAASRAYVWEDVPPVATYCTAGVTALGCQASIGSTGKASASGSAPFEVTLTGMEGQVSGLFFFGTGGPQASPWGNGTSYQCVAPPVQRTPLGVSTGAPGSCGGVLSLDLGAWMLANPAKAPAAGTTVDLQGWFRDPASTSNQTTSLSDALELVVAL